MISPVFRFLFPHQHDAEELRQKVEKSMTIISEKLEAEDAAAKRLARAVFSAMNDAASDKHS